MRLKLFVWQALLALGVAMLGILGVRAAERVGQAGDWLVGCDWDADSKTASCFAASVVQQGDYDATVFYYISERRVVVLDKQRSIDIIARVDNGAPYTGKCENQRCILDDKGLIDALEKGSGLALLFSGADKGPAAVDRNLRDLQKAVALAKQWVANRGKPGTAPGAPSKPQAVTPPPNPSAVPPDVAQRKQIARFGLWRVYCSPTIKDDDQKCHIEAERKMGEDMVFALLLPIKGGMGFAVVSANNVALGGDDFTLAARIGTTTVPTECAGNGPCLFRDDRFYEALANNPSVELILTRPGKGVSSWVIDANHVRQSATAVFDWLKLPASQR